MLDPMTTLPRTSVLGTPVSLLLPRQPGTVPVRRTPDDDGAPFHPEHP
jgi:hypothetical protein